MRVSVVLSTVGRILRFFGLVFILPLVVELGYGNWRGAFGFAITGAAASALGVLLYRWLDGSERLSRLEGLAVVGVTWLAVALVGAIPYLWNGLSGVDAAFESMSGFTTTGATIFRDFSLYTEGLFLWRALTQWFGGMGVIALFIAVLPALAVAGRQLFFAEAPGPTEDRLLPRIRNTATALWSLYVGLTLLEIVLLERTGMPLFDAVCHSLTSLSAGGFSPNPESIAGYHNPAAEWVIIAFMFVAGANYSLQFWLLRGRPGRLFANEEFRVYVAVVLLGSAALVFSLLPFAQSPSASYVQAESGAGVLDGASFETISRQAVFQTLTLVTTAGFASDDFELWNEASKAVLLLLMFLGGSAGSAAGGPKLVRLWLMLKFCWLELFRALHPRAVRPVRFNGRPVADEVIRSILGFLTLYLLIFALSSVALVGAGLGLMDGISASIATLGNVGPGFGAVGPMANYADLPTWSKWLLFFNMWIGRLEIITVLVFLQPDAWRGLSWRDHR